LESDQGRQIQTAQFDAIDALGNLGRLNSHPEIGTVPAANRRIDMDEVVDMTGRENP
jgi:hypothetical protein